MGTPFATRIAKPIREDAVLHMDGVETPMLTVEQVVYQDARQQLLPRAQRLHEMMVDVGKTLEVLPATPRARMVVAVHHMGTVARRRITAVPDAKVDVPPVEEPQQIQNPPLRKQSLS
ncbi:MAG: hypothetical protein Q9195_000882 [Heterodermia aff. obscurata]